MKLAITSLPSQGFCEAKQDFIELNPLTYRQLLKYTSAQYSTKNEQLIWDIENMIQDIPGWELLSSFDITALLFTRRMITATFEPELKLTYGKTLYNIKVSDIHFKDMSDDLKRIETVIINEKRYKFHIPTIYDYYKVLSYTKGMEEYANDYSTDLILLSSCLIPEEMYKPEDPNYKPDVIPAFKKVSEVVENATHEDILVIESILTLLKDRLNDVTVHGEGGETAISLNGLTADIFRLIWLNSDPISERIEFRENVEHGHNGHESTRSKSDDRGNKRTK